MKNNSFVRVVLFIIICYYSANAENRYFDWIEKSNFPLRTRLNLDLLILEKEVGLYKWESIGPIYVSNEDLKLLTLKFQYGDPFIISKDKVRFVLQGTGLVFDFNLSTKSLQRVDKTIHSGYNFSSTRFYRNNVLFSVGGQGFWTYNKHLSYFDENRSQEWELFRPINDGPEVISEGFQGYSPSTDTFFSGGGFIKNYNEDEKTTENRVFSAFYFKTKEWRELGEINSIITIKNPKTIYWNGTYFIQLAKDRLYIIDPVKNKIYAYQDNVTYFEDGLNYYVSNDSIVYFRLGNRGIGQIIPVNSYLKKSTYIGTFYTKKSVFPNYLFGIIGLLILLLIIYFRRKKNQFSDFDSIEIGLMKFMYHSEKKIITTNDLNEILECDKKSQESQRRIRHLVINHINHQFEQKYQIRNAIIRVPCPEDKRVNHYQFNPNYEEKLRRILKNILA